MASAPATSPVMKKPNCLHIPTAYRQIKLSTPSHDEQVTVDDVGEWTSVNNQSPTQAIREATSRSLLGSIPNDSPPTQRTEDYSENNDSYPVGHVFLPDLQTNARDQERQIVERVPIIPTLPDPNLQQTFAEMYYILNTAIRGAQF